MTYEQWLKQVEDLFEKEGMSGDLERAYDPSLFLSMFGQGLSPEWILDMVRMGKTVKRRHQTDSSVE
jgi:hypothetical protein